MKKGKVEPFHAHENRGYEFTFQMEVVSNPRQVSLVTFNSLDMKCP